MVFPDRFSQNQKVSVNFREYFLLKILHKPNKRCTKMTKPQLCTSVYCGLPCTDCQGTHFTQKYSGGIFCAELRPHFQKYVKYG